MTILKMKYAALLVGVSLSAGIACRKNHSDRGADDEMGASTGGTMTSNEDDDDDEEAEADIKGAEGKEIEGEAKFKSTDGGVRVSVDVENAPPGSKGIHIHEKGDCSDIPGKSMGSHFAPDGHDHALPNQGVRHLGDLGNIPVGEDGKGHLEIIIAGANLKEGDPKSFLGKSIVIHEDADKGSLDQPAGASGTPMACGVIEED